MDLKLTRILCYILYAILTVLLMIGLALFVLQLNSKSISCGLSERSIVEIVNLENNKESIDDQNQNQTETIDFTGKYELIKSENFDKFLEELGVSFLQRTIANKATAEYEITRDQDLYTLRTISPFRESEISFKLNGEEFEENRLDGNRVKSSIVQKGNKWIQKQSDDNKVVRIVREFKDDTIRVSGAVNNVGFVRIYKKIK